jgi:hypothetical protein
LIQFNGFVKKQKNLYTVKKCTPLKGTNPKILFSVADLFPFAPEIAIKAAIPCASPTTIVFTSHFMYLIVSYIAKDAVTDPPGLFIISIISFLLAF